MVVQHLKQIGKVKKYDKCVLHALFPNEKKNHHFEVLASLFMCNDNKSLRESIPRQIDETSRDPKKEIGVWGSRRRDRGLEFSKRRKGQTILSIFLQFSSVQFISVTQSCLILM